MNLDPELLRIVDALDRTATKDLLRVSTGLARAGYNTRGRWPHRVHDFPPSDIAEACIQRLAYLLPREVRALQDASRQSFGPEFPIRDLLEEALQELQAPEDHGPPAVGFRHPGPGADW